MSDGILGANLSSEDVNSTIKITSEEFADALRPREIIFGNDENRAKDIYTLQNCFNSNLLEIYQAEVIKQIVSLLVPQSLTNFRYSLTLTLKVHTFFLM